MRNTTKALIGLLVVVVIIIAFASYENNISDGVSGNGGNVYVGVTDATSDISNVNDINLSVKKVEIHSATSGWMTVSSDQKQYELLSLNASGKTQLYATKTNVEPGSYDKVRVTLGDTTVQTKNNGDVKATMPSSQIVMNTNLKVNDNENTNFKLDFLADKSLHMTSDNQYVFAPVVDAESRSMATVDVAGDNTLNVSGGNVDDDANVGVDLDGSSKENFALNTDNTLKVQSNIGGQIQFMLGGKSYTSDDTKTQEDENIDPNVNTNLQINSALNGETDQGSTSDNGQAGVNITTPLTY